MLRREMVYCEGGAGLSWPPIPKVVRLEVGSMGRKVKAHISGATGILAVREFPAVGTARCEKQVAGEVLARPPHWRLQSDSACLDKRNAVLDRRWRYHVGNHAVIVWRLAAGIGGGGGLVQDGQAPKAQDSRVQRAFSPALGELGPRKFIVISFD